MKKFTFHLENTRLRLVGSAPTPPDSQIIMNNIKAIKKELETLNNNLNFITNPILLDQLIFQIKAAEVHYQYWYKLGRENALALAPSNEGQAES